MAKAKKEVKPVQVSLVKSPTGIMGLDEITGGGFPKGRPTLVCGGPGSGKTVLAMEFLVRGALQYDEPGVFMAFEETEEDLKANFASLGFDLDEMIKAKKIALDHVYVNRSDIIETGEYDLSGLFLRLETTIKGVGAKRVVLDTIETLFSGFENEAILRAELQRLFRWLKSRGVTAVITGERGDGSLSRYGLEEYVADCVILLDNRVREQLVTRRLRIIKYRGSSHGVDEYPFLVGNRGISVLPVTSMGLAHTASVERVSSGNERLDFMLDGKGFYRGSSILISGTAGTGKTSFAAHFIDAACRRGERSLFFAFEESESQILRNMRSIGIDLDQWIKKGLLRTHSARPTVFGLEAHLLGMHRLVEEWRPSVVTIDPVSNLMSVGDRAEVTSMLMRLIDYLKANGITCLCTDLTPGNSTGEYTEVRISSLMDTWICLSYAHAGGERNRSLSILKSRGMGHSNQLREVLITDHGVDLKDVYLGPGGVPMGSARSAQEAVNKAEELARKQDTDRKRRELERKRKMMEAQLTLVRTQFEAEEELLKTRIEQEEELGLMAAENREELGRVRRADKPSRGKRR
jgi:circadian clock protein KaiC